VRVALDTAWLTVLAARASTLGERLARAVVVEADAERSERRLRRWSEVVARGDEQLFHERLALDGHDRRSAAAVVGEAVGSGAVPEWAELVADALDRARESHSDDDRLRAQGDDVPLLELTVPFVRAARARLRARIEPAGSVVGPEVLPTLERQLARQLAALASPLADVEFRLWRKNRIHPLEEALARKGGSPGRELYDAWVAELLDGGLEAMLVIYAVLARQLGTVALGWVDATAEFLERLEADSDALSSVFGGGQPLGPLEEIVSGIASDPHRGRRRVLGCRFESGLRLVYKPKNLTTEVAYGALVDWLNGHSAEPELRVLHVLDRGDHGWVEMADHAGVADHSAARRFYRRTGMLLAILYAVGGKDCHMDNFVAAGEDPVVVDAETVLHPTLIAPDAGEELDAVHLAGDAFTASVLAVGLLPAWMIGPDGRALDISALGAVTPQEGLEPAAGWEHANTDVARIVMERRMLPAGQNVLCVDGVAQRPEEYLDDICAGFADAYRALLLGRDELFARAGPLCPLEHAPVRVLIRATRLYFQVASDAQQPTHMREGVDRSIELELLGRPLLDSPDRAGFWELHRSEQEQLEATDIPYFTAPGGAEALRAADGRTLVGFRASAVETAKRQLAALSEEDQRLQLALLRAALATRFERQLPVRVRESPTGASAPAPGPSREAALEAAAMLARELEATAIHSGPSVAWVGLSLGDEAERWTLGVTAFDIYAGSTGIAIFLAALARVTGEARWRQLSLAALATSLEQTERHPGRLAVLRGTGGAIGFGALVYGFVLVASLLQTERPLAAAQLLAGALPVAAFEKDRVIDLLGGTAGALAGLLALDRALGGDQAVIELAEAAGRFLAGRAVEHDDGAAWKTLGGRELDGFAHGNAGIALALARLSARTGDAALAKLVRSAVTGESSRFDPALGGWPDRRYEEPKVMSGWCHGAAGIGLARVGLAQASLGHGLEELIDRDLQRAKAALAAAQPNLDHLCCGGAGESEFLFDLAALRGDEEAGALAQARCDDVAARIVAGERPRLTRPDADVPSPGLFQGTSGLGLSLLRRAAPDLPSVLAWR
jgi:type 2 lantibiotic biosynthesis protein LanM